MSEVRYHKIGLLVINEDRTKFLVKRKAPYSMTQQWLMPGGLLDEHSERGCLYNEIKEELNCEVDFSQLQYVGNYQAPASGVANVDVHIKLYEAPLIGMPHPGGEIKELGWIGREDIHNEEVSVIIREKIIPDLIEKEILL